MPDVSTGDYVASAGHGQSPFGPLAQLTQIQNAANQNKLFQQQFAARQAMGGIMQQSIDPQSGIPNYDKAATLMALNPATSFMAPEFIKALADRKLVEQQTIEKSLENSAKRFTAIGNAASSLVSDGHAKGDKVERGDVIAQIALLRGQNLLREEDAMNFLAQMPKDPSEVYKMLLKVGQQAQGAGKTLDGVFQRLTTPLGGYTQQGSQNVYENTYTPAKGGDLEHSPTPGEMNTLTKAGVTPTGAELLAPRKDVAPMSGGLGTQMTVPMAPPRPLQWTQNTAPITGEPVGSGAAGANVSGSGGAAPKGTIQTSLGPYKEGALKEVAEKYEPALNDRARQANQLDLLIKQAQEETKNFKQGGGASIYMQMGQLAQAMGLKDSAVDKLANGDLARTQAANKLFMQVGSLIAGGIINAGGGRMTQTEWQQILSKGAANIDMDPKAIAKILAAMREVTHYTKLESEAFGAAKQRAESGSYDLTNFQNDWQKNLGAHIDKRGSK